MAVYEAAGEAVARARKGEGPTLIEAKTYRFRGHFEGDAGTYRPKEEVEEWLKRDPIPNFKEKLIKMKVLTEKEAEEIDRAAREEMEEAVKFALESPFPEPEEALRNVYS
jgi:TPP-dependent pyruvate/acetoin dehydrogenase alpha subunit